MLKHPSHSILHQLPTLGCQGDSWGRVRGLVPALCTCLLSSVALSTSVSHLVTVIMPCQCAPHDAIIGPMQWGMKELSTSRMLENVSLVIKNL